MVNRSPSFRLAVDRARFSCRPATDSVRKMVWAAMRRNVLRNKTRRIFVKSSAPKSKRVIHDGPVDLASKRQEPRSAARVRGRFNSIAVVRFVGGLIGRKTVRMCP